MDRKQLKLRRLGLPEPGLSRVGKETQAASRELVVASIWYTDTGAWLLSALVAEYGGSDY